MRSISHLLLAVSALALAATVRAEEPLRFSKTIPTTAESAELGLTQLSADQLAVLDALIRQDVKNWDYVAKTPRADRFSARLNATERHNAGLDLLSDAQLVRLDTAVERLMPTAPRGSYAATTAAVTTTSTAPAALRAVKINRSPEIHGSVSLMVAAGSHGYSAYGGAVEVNYTDPASRFSIAVAYSEVHSKGGPAWGSRGYYDGFGYDPFYSSYPGYSGYPGAPWW